jgi:hypothetical protein
MINLLMLLGVVFLIICIGVLLQVYRLLWRVIRDMDEYKSKVSSEIEDEEESEDESAGEEPENVEAYDDEEISFYDVSPHDFTEPIKESCENKCVVAQINGYYTINGVHTLAEFLVNTGSCFSKYKFNVKCLLSCVIS